MAAFFSPAPAAEMQAARIVTGAAMALFLMVGLVPSMRPYAARLRLLVLVAYLVACGGLVGYALLR